MEPGINTMTPAQLDEKMSPIYESDEFKQRPERVQEIMREYPPWGFYVYSDAKQPDIPIEFRSPFRLYGVYELDGYTGNARYGFHRMRAMFVFPNGGNEEVYIDGGEHPTFQRVDRWSEYQLIIISSFISSFMNCSAQQAFLEPMGFIAFY